MGMSDLAYWTSWGLWEVTLSFFTAHLIACFGKLSFYCLSLAPRAADSHSPQVGSSRVPRSHLCHSGLLLQFDLFLNNNYGLLFFLFFMFLLAMSSLALFMASFISRTQTATYLGFTLFIIGWIMQAGCQRLC
jgi:hypothetical protein